MEAKEERASEIKTMEVAECSINHNIKVAAIEKIDIITITISTNNNMKAVASIKSSITLTPCIINMKVCSIIIGMEEV